MSQLLQALVSAVRTSPDSSIRPVKAQYLSEEQSQRSDSEPVRRSAQVVEGNNGPDPVCAGPAKPGLFTHFMDGIQRVHTPITVNHIPVVYGYTSAVIRQRRADRRMYTWRQQVSEALYCPLNFIDIGWLQDSDIRVVDTADGMKAGNDNLLAFLNIAHDKVSTERAALERQLINDWLENFDCADNWLLIDGSLSGNYNKYSLPNIVGVIKSHQTQYFSAQEQQQIVSMPAGFRSRVFIPQGRNRPEVYSWYLRLRPSEGQNAYFGLVRVEAAAIERTLLCVDEISGRLLAERTPLSLPDFRWDKMIYPIRDCEMYLKAKAPSRVQLESLMTGR